MVKALKISLKIFIICLVLSIIAIGAIAGRILYAPLTIPYISSFSFGKTSTGDAAWNIAFDKAVVGWDRHNVRLWMQFDSLMVENASGNMAISFDEAWTAFGPSILYGGDLEIKGVSALNGLVRLRQGGNGPSFFDDLDFSKGPRVVGPLVSEILAADKRITNLELVNIAIEIQNLQEEGLVKSLIPSIHRTQKGDQSTIAVHADFFKSEDQISTKLDLTANHKTKEVFFSFEIDPIAPSVLMAGFDNTEATDALSALHFPVGIKVDAKGSVSKGLEFGEMLVAGSEGYLQHGQFFPNAVPVDDFMVKAQYNRQSETIELTDIKADLGKHKLYGDGVLYFEDDVSQLGVKANIKLDNILVVDIPSYWPITGSGSTRDFVKNNISRGSVNDLTFQIDKRPDGTGAWENNSIYKLDFRFSGLKSTVLSTMPDIEAANGFAVLTREKFALTVLNGSVDGVPIKKSTFVTQDIHIPKGSKSYIDLVLEGTTKDILRLANNEPVGLNSRLDIDANRLGGDLTVRYQMQGPLRADAPKGSLDYKVLVMSDNFIMTDILKGPGIRQGVIDMTITKDAVVSAGTIRLNGVPLNYTMQEDLTVPTNQSKASTRLKLSGRIDGDQLAALNVPFDPYLRSAIPIEIEFTGNKGTLTRATFAGDATNGLMHIPQLGWAKIVGRPARITGELSIEKTTGYIENLKLLGENIDITANANFPLIGQPGSTKATIAIKQLDATKDLNVSVLHSFLAGYQVLMRAEELDIRGILNFKEQNIRNRSLVSKEPIKMNINLQANRIVMANGVRMHDAKFISDFPRGEPKNSKFTGIFDDGTTAEMAIDDSAQSPRRFTIQSTNAGKLLRGLGLFVHGDYGTLFLEGETRGWADTFELIGMAWGTDLKLVPTTMLGPEVTEGRMPGLDKIAGAEGEIFDIYEVPFSFKSGLLDISDMNANNNSIGLTLEGQLDRNAGLINMNGVFIPAYGVNSFLNKVPILGTILSGGKNEGVIGVTYRVKGSLENPDVSVNPLSSATPGILRKIFGGGKGKIKKLRPADEKLDEALIEIPIEGQDAPKE